MLPLVFYSTKLAFELLKKPFQKFEMAFLLSHNIVRVLNKSIDMNRHLSACNLSTL